MNLPCKNCNGKCCKNPTFSAEEFDLVQKKYGMPDPTRFVGLAGYVVMLGKCAFLGKDWCSIYPDRPKLCREYGETIPCRYGDTK